MIDIPYNSYLFFLNIVSNGEVHNILLNTERHSTCKFNKQKKIGYFYFSHDLFHLKLKEKFLTSNKSKRYVYMYLNSQIRKILEYVTILNKYIDRIQMLHS